MTVQLLARFGGRPLLVAIAALNAITGIAAAVILAPLSFGADAVAFRDGAAAIAAGGFDKDFLYTPLAGLVARPLTWIPPEAAAVLMTALGIGLVVAGVVVETRGLAAIDRVLVLVAALTFIPVVNEVLLGQVTLVFAGALWLIARRPDAVRTGLFLGVAFALAPKPLLLPVFLWLLVRRPRALVGVLAAGVITLGVGLLLMGLDLHRQWLDVLANTGSVTRRGNLSLWTGGVGTTPLLTATLVAVVALVAILRDEAAGFAAALLAGLLLAPYTLLYSASILLVAVAPALRVSPVATRVLALVANPMVIAAFGIWCVAGLVSMLGATRKRVGAAPSAGDARVS